MRCNFSNTEGAKIACSFINDTLIVKPRLDFQQSDIKAIQ